MKARDAAVDKFSYLCINFISAINEIADNFFLSALNKLKASAYYKREIKCYANNAMKEIRKCIDTGEVMMDGEPIYFDFVDTASEYVEHDINILYFALKKEFDDAGVEESELFARIETVRILLEENTVAFRDLCSEIESQFGVHIMYLFAQFNPDKALFWWKQMENKLLDGVKTSINFNESEPVKMAYGILHDKYVGADFIGKALEKAKELHPDYTQKVINPK